MTYQEISKKFEAQKTKHLFYSLGLDALGMGTYLIPFLGELGDMIFAPLYGIAIFSMYKMRVGSAMVGGITGFVEELLPGTDIIPTATVMWAYNYVARRESTFKKFVNQEGKDRVMVDRVAQGLSATPSLWTRMNNFFTGTSSNNTSHFEDADTMEGNNDTPRLQ